MSLGIQTGSNLVISQLPLAWVMLTSTLSLVVGARAAAASASAAVASAAASPQPSWRALAKIITDCTPVSRTVLLVANIGVATEIRRGPIRRMITHPNFLAYLLSNGGRMPRKILPAS